MKRPEEAGSLKVGSFIIIDDEPCRVVDIEKSKAGKHGSAKVRIVAVGVFDGKKRSYVGPADSQIEVPIIEKKIGQVIAVTPKSLQVMDLSTYEVFEVAFPDEPEIRSKLSPGIEVEYWEIAGRRKIMRVK
ncbi:MAG: translation initiation factor IF-5A [Candidatus Methanomethylicia archaeon]|nr:translation initiation factor IF-5A [Candidatus Methanomethylicia archaeon]MCX8169254.1 translation initiation factor IF-5A [Candidatus Methanomethylicia archaeon]MDW7988964.1 translation initiation factor IF-5A [Nitrososphaerota archaeon]